MILLLHYFGGHLTGPGNFCLVHVSLVPVLNVVGEQVFLVISYCSTV